MNATLINQFTTSYDYYETILINLKNVIFLFFNFFD